MRSVRAMISLTATVIRGGLSREIAISQLVPGDIVALILTKGLDKRDFANTQEPIADLKSDAKVTTSGEQRTLVSHGAVEMITVTRWQSGQCDRNRKLKTLPPKPLRRACPEWPGRFWLRADWSWAKKHSVLVALV